MGMRRLFIIRKDLHLSAGKLGAMVAHCAEGYWIGMINDACHTELTPEWVDENGEGRS